MQICGHPLRFSSSDFLPKQLSRFSKADTAEKVQLIFGALILSGTLISLCALLNQPQGLSPIGVIGLIEGALLGVGLIATTGCPISKEEKRIRTLRIMNSQPEETLIPDHREGQILTESLPIAENPPAPLEEEPLLISKADQQLPENRPILQALGRHSCLRQAREFKRFLADRVPPQESLSDNNLKRMQSITSEVYKFLVARIPTCGSHYPENFIENALKKIFSVTDELEFEKSLASLSLIPFFIELIKSIKREPVAIQKEMFILIQSLIEAEEDKSTWIYLCQMELRSLFDLLLTTLKPLSLLYHEDNQVIFNLIQGYITLLGPIYCEKEIANQKKRLEKLEEGIPEQEALEKFRQELTELHPPEPLRTNLAQTLGNCELRLHEQHRKQLTRTQNYLAHLQILKAVLPYIVQTVFFSPSATIIHSYLKYVNHPHREAFLFADSRSSRPLLPDYHEYAAFAHLIEQVVLSYWTIAPSIKARFFDILNPKEPSSVNLRGTFREKVTQLQEEFRIVKSALDTDYQEDLPSLSNRAKGLASLFFDTVSIRLTEEPYCAFIQEAMGVGSGLIDHFQVELPPNESLSSFLKKSFLIHKNLWKTPHLKNPGQFVESWINFFHHPMKRMGIDTQPLVHAVHEGTEIAFAWSSTIDEQTHEALRLVPFFEGIPILLSIFFSASFLDRVRPFLSRHDSVPITVLNDIQLLFGSLMEEDWKTILEDYKGLTKFGIKTVLGVLKPLNGLAMSDLPLKSTALNKIIVTAINKFIPQICSETLSGCFNEFQFPPVVSTLEDEGKKGAQKLIWRLICSARDGKTSDSVLCQNDTEWWGTNFREILSTNPQHILKSGWEKMLNREFPGMLNRKFEAWARRQNSRLARFSIAREALLSAWASFSTDKTPIQLIHSLVSYDQIWEKRIFVPLFQKLKLIESLEPFILFLADGVLGSASDRQIFSETQKRLRRFYHHLYNFNLQATEQQPESLVSHISEAFTSFFQTDGR